MTSEKMVAKHTWLIGACKMGKKIISSGILSGGTEEKINNTSTSVYL